MTKLAFVIRSARRIAVTVAASGFGLSTHAEEVAAPAFFGQAPETVLPSIRPDQPSAIKVPASALLSSGTANWDGAYIGVRSGYSVGADRWSKPIGRLDTPLSQTRFPSQAQSLGGIGGVAAGVAKEFGPFVIGAEANIDALSSVSRGVCGGIRGIATAVDWKCLASETWLATATLRFGYAFGSALIFGKAGLAAERVRGSISEAIASAPSPSVSSSLTRLGPAFGVGVEYALGAHWALRAEFDVDKFSAKSVAGADTNYPALGRLGASLTTNEKLIAFGVDYWMSDWGEPRDHSAPAPALFGDVSAEVGVRTGWSTGRFQKNLYGVPSSQLNSRLTWSDENGVPAEIFGRLQHPSGVFLQGYLGGVNLLDSRMHDEDFPPGISPYSNTISTTKNGRDAYGAIDLGFDFHLMPGFDLGPFVGYQRVAQSDNAYGCVQTSLNPLVCAPGLVGLNELSLTQVQNWNAARVGLDLVADLADRWRLSLSGAWLPLATLDGSDNHWLRSSINPLPETGHASGLEAAGSLSYRVTDRMSLGFGGRYMMLKASNAQAAFPTIAPSPLKVWSSRWTAFVQASYALEGK